MIRKLLDHARGTPKGLALLLIARMGLRQREVIELRVRDFRVEDHALAITAPFVRVQPAPDDCFQALVSFAHGRDGEEYLIPGKNGANSPMGARSLQPYLRRLVEEVLGHEHRIRLREMREACIVNRLVRGDCPAHLQKEFGIVTDLARFKRLAQRIQGYAGGEKPFALLAP